MEPAEVYLPPKLKYGPDYPLLKVFQEFQEPQVVRWPPSTRFAYSNPGYGIAGYLIEKVTGQRFDAYIRQNILAPLEIAVGDFRLTEVNRPLLAQGYNGNPPHEVFYKHIYLRPAGDMKASPGELAKLVQFFLRRGRAGDVQLVKSDSIARMEYPETISSAKHGLRLGYGLANYTESDGGIITHGHDRGIDGFISSFRYMLEQNWGHVVLLNSTLSGKALGDMNHLAIEGLSHLAVHAAAASRCVDGCIGHCLAIRSFLGIVAAPREILQENKTIEARARASGAILCGAQFAVGRVRI